MEAWLNACCVIKYALIVKILIFVMGGGCMNFVKK